MKLRITESITKAVLGFLFTAALALTVGAAPKNEADMQQPQRRITGMVKTADGEPLPGATIQIKGASTGVVTDADGKYAIQAKESDVLVFSFIGFQTQEQPVGARSSINVVLAVETASVDEVVVVAYGVQKKESVTAAISTVQTKELKQSSQANLSTALQGRLPGLTVMQRSGQPGNDVVNLYLRGLGTLNDATPLILIDGVPRSGISMLDPNEVESISILKDASATAVFGVRGANGAILITTRRGEAGKAELSISADYSLQKFIVHADRLHSWEFAELRNQAYKNSNPTASESTYPFTQYMIDMYRSGEDPVFYPDRDVFHDYFRDWAPQTRLNANFNGGQKDFTYFLNAGYIGQGGNFKTEPESKLGYDPSYKMNRYNFRGNIDYKPIDDLKFSLNISSYLQRMNTPETTQLFGGSVTTMIENMIAYTWATPPTDPGPLTAAGYGVPAGEIVAQSGQDRNTYGEINRRGYRQQTSTTLNSSLGVDWKLNFITKGLSFKGLVAFDTSANTVLEGHKDLDSYSVTVAREAGGISSYSPINSNQDTSISISKNMSTSYYTNYQLSLNYARTFAEDHNVTGMLLYQRDHQDYGAAVPHNVIGMIARVTYDYAGRYLAEFNYGRNGSEQFAPANRFGSFPSYSIGWVASREEFLKDNPVISFLKIRGSYGITGNDSGQGRFLYQSSITMGSGIYSSLGRGQQVNQGLIGNDHVQWEKAEKKNAGLEIGLFDAITITADVFSEHRDKILITRKTVPILQGVPISNIPKVNLGIVDNKGAELEVGYRKNITNDISFNVKGNIAYNRNEVIFADEVRYGSDYAYPFRSTGYSIGTQWGYLIDYSNGNGYINTQSELDNLPTYAVGGVPRLGDFMYKDIAGVSGPDGPEPDGVVNDRDIAPIGYPSVPRISYGFSGSLEFHDFDFSFLFTGIGQSSWTQTDWGVTEFGLVGFYSGWHRNAWTPERYVKGDKITYPALGTSQGVSQRANSVFIMDRSFLRLKNIELGYNIPKTLLKSINMSRARIYVNGNNLWTWTKLPVNVVDPEMSYALSYGLTKMVNFGINVTF
ncbi:MAG: TonB-dependent receptor [Bacteroidales bacterium]|jgi:TonB-linked SusC/RagA family outer membrane protein|nr:TonB-dependent receptor [Bacteroidales bacterium]